jgi:hypothetical protein
MIIGKVKLCAGVLIIMLASAATPVLAQNDDDISSAAMYAKKYKDEDIMCTSAYSYFTFDKGKNSLNDKVVEIEENSEYEFLSLKKFASMTYPEFYNKFIVLNTFKKACKVWQQVYYIRQSRCRSLCNR